MTAFYIGELVVCHGNVCEITGVLYECRTANGSVSIRVGARDLRPATPEERAMFVAVQTQKLDKQIAELMAYRKQLEDGIA
jgi:hypothetical protein